MTDIDFDELDKAVNSLMADVDTSKRPAGLDDPIDTVVAIETHEDSSPVLVDSVASPVALETTLAPAVAVEPPLDTLSATTPAVKRRGQFMDVMHPSSDMKGGQSIGRQGISITPATLSVPTRPLSQENESSTPDDHAVETPSDEHRLDEVTPQVTDVMPDGIEDTSAPLVSPLVADPEPDETLGVEPPVVDEPVFPVSSDGEVAPDSSVMPEVEPLGSPFIPDAKVEKRPLGSPLLTEAGSDDISPVSVESTTAEDTDANESADVHLPEELKSDVVSIESSVSNPMSTTTASIASAATIAAGSGAGSINQQYTEQPPTGDQTNGAIYDTAAYHQPIETPKVAKKKFSVLKFATWIIVFLLIGVAIGAAVFYFTTR